MALRADFSPNTDSQYSWRERYKTVRAQTVSLIDGLSDADCTVQSMPDASPAKWHLAHTSWFWEEFLICANNPDTDRFHLDYAFLFNSYYEAVGDRHQRQARGLLSRPDLETVLAYRDHVDAQMMELLSAPLSADQIELIALGLAHEEQHQELLLTDILHLFSCNPLKPAYRQSLEERPNPSTATELTWTAFPDVGIVRIGHEGEGFAFDCEGPAHNVLLRPFAMANRAVTNAEWMRFIDDGGYECPAYWLSDAWVRVQEEGWKAPLYWEKRNGDWFSLTLHGLKPVNPEAPVCHISFYEADAFASWVAEQEGFEGVRLPLEAEWEYAGQTFDPARNTSGNTIGTQALRPLTQSGETLSGLFGDVWEWTASPFTPYPGFSPAAGAVGEYNGKFMSGQQVLRGGSCVTPDGHVRASYRNFFHPEKRWQFSGLRLAKSI